MKRYEPPRKNNMTGGNPIPPRMDKPNNPPHHPTDDPRNAKDGFDNTGTQGYDSLSDDGYAGSSDNKGKSDDESHTGSSAEDFHDIVEDNKALNPSDGDDTTYSGV